MRKFSEEKMGKTIRKEKAETFDKEISPDLFQYSCKGDSRSQHLLNRQVRHFPYEAVADGRDYGRKHSRKAWERRQRKISKAICEEAIYEEKGVK